MLFWFSSACFEWAVDTSSLYMYTTISMISPLTWSGVQRVWLEGRGSTPVRSSAAAVVVTTGPIFAADRVDPDVDVPVT